MPSINAVMWNIQTLGQEGVPPYSLRGNWPILASFIANAIANVEADVLMIEELVEAAIAAHVLDYIQEALNALPPPRNNWYFDWIKGAISTSPAVLAPYASSDDLMWDDGHHEGYAVFWNQNIAKFTVTAAPPIQDPTLPNQAPVANTQSSGVTIQVYANNPNAPQGPVHGTLPADGIRADGGQYTLPAGTQIPGYQPLPGPQVVNAGFVLPVNTVIGAGGVSISYAAANLQGVVVIPGAYTLTDALTLPPAATVLAPGHSMSLVFFGRYSGTPPATLPNPSLNAADIFNPNAPNFNWLNFTQSGKQGAKLRGARRPAYITLNVNRAANNAADCLVPFIVYHAPSAAPASTGGMRRSSWSQPFYQAYDWNVGGWIDCNNSFLGGDFNVALDAQKGSYQSFTLPLAQYGAASVPLVNNAGGAAAVDNKSTVQLAENDFVTQIYSALPADYRKLAIDNVFYRMTAPAANGTLYDLQAAVSSAVPVAGSIPPGVIQSFLGVQYFAAYQRFVQGLGAQPPQGSLVSPRSTYNDLWWGYLGQAGSRDNNTAARRAAEFVRLCVSDHLPVWFRVTLG